MYGQSSVRLVDLQTGSVIREHKMDPTDFGEGLTKLGDTCVFSRLLAPGYTHPRMPLNSCGDMIRNCASQVPPLSPQAAFPRKCP